MIGSSPWAFLGWWLWFLSHFPDRHAKFWNMVAFPLAPVGFAQTCQHRGAFVLDRDDQVVFFCLALCPVLLLDLRIVAFL
jgi:hypothetical protein